MSFGLHCWASKCLMTMTTMIDGKCVAAEALAPTGCAHITQAPAPTTNARRRHARARILVKPAGTGQPMPTFCAHSILLLRNTSVREYL